MNARKWREVILSDLGILIALAILRILLQFLTNNQYGFHRDELAILDDARYLAWGYVAYPPLTPFIGRIAMELFGPSIAWIRLFSGLAQGAALVFTGLIAKELGGRKWAVIMSGLAVFIAPVSFAQGALFQYVSFDYLWWVLIAYFMLRLINSDHPRWWLGIGAMIGLGMMTKYTMMFFVAGLIAGVLLTPVRRYLKSLWLWGAVGLALLIFLPNLIWQVQHQFISLVQLETIHAHDIAIGRTDNFILDQFLLGGNPLTFIFWIAGLYFYFSSAGKQYRVLGWMYLIPFVLFILLKGRGYYLAPAYPMLLAAGMVITENWSLRLRPWISSMVKGLSYVLMAIGAVFIFALAMPIGPVTSEWWQFASAANSDLKEEIGWPELVATVATIRDNLPQNDRAHVGVLTNNYGEAGAINMYGPALSLPSALSAVNSYWLRGFPNPPPETLIIIGYERKFIEPYFENCELAGQNIDKYNIQNEESKVPDIFVCSNLKGTWKDFWQSIRHFG